MHVTLADAEIAIVSASKRAAELETKMCIAIVDSGANLKAFHRMDDAWVGSVDIAIKKQRLRYFLVCPLARSASCRSQAVRSSESNIRMKV
jgi:uncharacterized protein GlcG (DUF336 family)